MSTVQQAIEVSAPLHTVYERFATFTDYPQFMTGIREMTPVSDTAAHMIMDMAGEQREFDAQITECRPDERVTWRATDGPTLSEVITLRPVDRNRTHIIAQLEADVHEVMPSDLQATESLNRRLKADLASFKRYIERDTTPTPAAMPPTRPPRGMAMDTGGTLEAGEDAAMGSALVGGPGAGSSGTRTGSGRSARDMDLDLDRLGGVTDLDEERGGSRGM